MKLREKLVSLSLRFVPPNKEINYFRLNKPWTDKFLHALLVAFSTFEKPRVNLLPEEEQGLSKLLGLSQEVFSRTGWIHLVVEEDSVPSSVRPLRGDVTMKWMPTCIYIHQVCDTRLHFVCTGLKNIITGPPVSGRHPFNTGAFNLCFGKKGSLSTGTDGASPQ